MIFFSLSKTPQNVDLQYKTNLDFGVVLKKKTSFYKQINIVHSSCILTAIFNRTFISLKPLWC